MNAAHGIRRAISGDVPALAGMLTRAFFDDPVLGWACPRERLRKTMLERFQSTRLRQLLAHQEVWTSPRLSCAALWAPPGHFHTTAREDLELAATMRHPRVVWRLPLVLTGLLNIQRHHPSSPPHWYLAVLGTEPSEQGKGLGSALMRPVLDRCDADGVAAYLESSKEQNIDFYARHGFRVTKELRLPRGPLVWPMWRDPRP